VRTAGATAVAVAGSRAVAGGDLRALSWALQGTGVDLVVAPAMTDVAGPRISVRLVEGLPLLHVEEPELAGVRRAVKGALDRIGACLLGLLCAPLLLAIALAIKVTSSGPVFFRQERVGLGGRTFSMLKFRSMRQGAEEECAGLVHLNVHDGPLFKIRNDPRVTAVGRWLRRHSLDELPQLWNVVRGSMSLVGPRPPLPAEVERYGAEAMRRLLVKPGMTGLWQINGRSELPWEETVRLDLFYVENWSVGLDLMVLAKTLPAVLRCRGAY
jgi:exopolysaccharide biosynthesis polyprenyl glycosylphosphotransferase